jgi:hypothetical protein
MATENAAQGHITVDEEEVVVEMNWQFGTLIIFLRKRYGSVVVCIQS